MINKFKNFLQSIKNNNNSILVETIQKSFIACFENEIVNIKKISYNKLPENIIKELNKTIYHSEVTSDVTIEFFERFDPDESEITKAILTFTIWPTENEKLILKKIVENDDVDVRMNDKGIKLIYTIDMYNDTLLEDLIKL